MDWFDDIQIEELSNFDYQEDPLEEELFEENNDEKAFQAFLKSNWDFWSKHS